MGENPLCTKSSLDRTPLPPIYSPWCRAGSQTPSTSTQRKTLYWIEEGAVRWMKHVHVALVVCEPLAYLDGTVKVHIIPNYDVYRRHCLLIAAMQSCKSPRNAKRCPVLYGSRLAWQWRTPPVTNVSKDGEIATPLARDFHMLREKGAPATCMWSLFKSGKGGLRLKFFSIVYTHFL